MSDTKTKLATLRTMLKDRDFQHSRGLSNEVSYYILGYTPKDQPAVREEIEQMKRQMNEATIGINIIEFDVYRIMWNIIDDMGIHDDVLAMEADEGIDYLAEQLNNALGMTDSDNMLVQYMEEHLDKTNSVVFITGIGEIFPLIRAHKILNTMHQVISSVPVVLFYPGKYDSLKLSMFGEIQEDNYYRAFQIN
ncbi:DUF1788 domain-containing protein [Lactiplantibacillus paraxiangfangensis]|uniref:DUF1788 domain-containing protein n=1 Tax=Lactiplantibacillus paraxiangfangensis TaxID=3076224 RepID=UPI0030C72E18